jgi:flavin-dependent dehydrogenase
VREYDIVIVGASFAGLACARTAAMRGLRVAVVERKADPGLGVRTTGLLVKEAVEEADIPAQYTRIIREVRLYAPNGRSVDLHVPGYYFLATNTPDLLRWMAREAARAGAELTYGRAFRSGIDTGSCVEIPDLGLKGRLLVGADGTASAVARHFGLDRNTRFLCGVEHEFELEPGVDPRFLHCFLNSKLAPGYIAWVVPGMGLLQVGLAASGGVRPDIEGFTALLRSRLGLRLQRVIGRRSGLIPSGATLARTHNGRVMVIGDAAGHVSPLTGGGIAQTFRLGRRCAQLASDWIFVGGDHPAEALAREAPGFRGKLMLRRLLDTAPPNWVWNAAIGMPAFHAMARGIYFHKRGASTVGASVEANAQGLAQEPAPKNRAAGRARDGV